MADRSGFTGIVRMVHCRVRVLPNQLPQEESQVKYVHAHASVGSTAGPGEVEADVRFSFIATPLHVDWTCEIQLYVRGGSWRIGSALPGPCVWAASFVS